jgi:hypothetical protein
MWLPRVPAEVSRFSVLHLAHGNRHRPKPVALMRRSLLGTRIELAYLLVRIETGSEPNHWASWRQQALQLQKFRKSMEEQQERIEAQGQRLENLHAEGATHT